MEAGHFTLNRFEPCASILHSDVLVSVTRSPHGPADNLDRSDGSQRLNQAPIFNSAILSGRKSRRTTPKAGISLFDSKSHAKTQVRR
jgi:hypothetical protein